jgi:predicted transcriptional regulator
MDNALMQMVKKRQGKVFICDKQDRLLGIISKMQMVKKRQGKVFICDKQDRLLGIISKTDVLAIASERQDYFKHATTSK